MPKKTSKAYRKPRVEKDDMFNLFRLLVAILISPATLLFCPLERISIGDEAIFGRTERKYIIEN
jgi:hypothetical protein